MNAAVRALARVDHSDPEACWLYPGYLDRNGYARLRVRTPDGYRMLRVHRMIYEHLVGPIPEGLELHHRCETPACCNPAHLEPVTHRDNLLRGNGWPGVNARKTHCLHGHPFDEANTLVTPDGRRQCRACGRASSAAYARRQREG